MNIPFVETVKVTAHYCHNDSMNQCTLPQFSSQFAKTAIALTGISKDSGCSSILI